MKIIITAAIILAYLASLTACGNTIVPSFESAGEPAISGSISGTSESPSMASVPSGQETEYVYYNYTATRGKGVPRPSVIWNRDGGFSIRQDDTILFLDFENNPVKTFTPAERQWAGMPDELAVWNWADPAFCDYLWNDQYVLARFTLHGSAESSVALQDGKPVITNAVIYNMDGNIVKLFPFSNDAGIKSRWGAPDFSWIVSTRTNIYWLTDDIFAVNTGDAIWLYSVSLDELRQVADYTQELLSAWQREETECFGASDYQCWVDGGKLYYARGEGIQRDIGSEFGPRFSLWCVDWNSPPVCLSGDRLYHEYLVKNGMILAMNFRHAQFGAEMVWMPDTGRLDEQTGEYTPCGTGGDITHAAIRENLLVYVTYKIEVPEGEQIKTIHCWDTAAGIEQTCEPIVPEGIKSDYVVHLLDVFSEDNGMILYYYVEDDADDAPGGRTISLVVHDGATGDASFIPLDWYAELPPGAGIPTHFLEDNGQGQVRLRPLA